ncbi:MAG: peptidase S24/S26A/S26B [Candidatus Adiutrix sp.]|jgi:DNA polymerase V|nr:peptidase S24/S26A/S26B [Candidatus Adiutrix sp.]
MTTESRVYLPAETAGLRPGGALLSLITADRPASPADKQPVDLQKIVVTDPAKICFLRVSGQAMVSAGIHDQDLVAIDLARSAEPGQVVVAVLDGQLAVRRLSTRFGRLWLTPENYDNPNFTEIDITGRQDQLIQGVVTYCLHAL